MVYLHFPSNLTEEELMLQAKYQKLKKKKKAVMALKAPKSEPEKPALGRGGGGGTQARDARELARKLLKSGAIRALASPAPKHSQASFKRPRAARERKTSGPGSLDKYQPFSASQEPAPAPPKSPPTNASLYDSMLTQRQKTTTSVVAPSTTATPTTEPQKPKSGGTTVFVLGRKISEDYLRKHMGPYGTITNISMEIEKNRGFVTFEKTDVAMKVIGEMNGALIGGIQLEVSMARRQPNMERINEASSSSSWCTLATSHSQKGPHRDGRTVVTYDDDLFSS